MTGADAEPARTFRGFKGALFVLIIVVALVTRLWAPGPTTESYDENLWLHRSESFSTALAHGHLARATAEDPQLGLTNPTMPGVTTMWAGVIGRQVAKVSGALGLSAPVEGPSWESPQVLRAAQSVVSIFCVALLVLLLVLLRRLFDDRVALLSGALLATEPWLAGLSHELHTDAMVTMFTITSLCALAWALHAERRHTEAAVPPPRTRWVLVAGACAAGALLTKTNAVGILGPGMALIVWDAWRHRYHGRAGELIRAALYGLVTVALVSVIAWPALVAAPFHQVKLMFDASKQVGKTRTRFFHGSVRGFIPQFYVVALAFRLSPWMIGWATVGIVGGVVAVARRMWPSRLQGRLAALARVPGWVFWTPIPYFVVISLSRFGYDRYALVVIPFGVIAGACVVAEVTRRFSWLRGRSPVLLGALGAVFLCASAIVPMIHAPYDIEYVNSITGGERTAVRWIPVESGQVSSQLDADLRGLVDGDCDDIRVADAYYHPAVDRCGEYFAPGTTVDLATADFAMTFRVGEQRPGREWYEPWLRDHAEVVSTVRVGGVVFGRLWRIDSASG